MEKLFEIALALFALYILSVIVIFAAGEIVGKLNDKEISINKKTETVLTIFLTAVLFLVVVFCDGGI